MSRGFCPWAHTGQEFGEWLRGTADHLWRVDCSNGVTQVKASCNNCGESSGAIPFRVLDAWGIDRDTLPILRSYRGEPCVVVGCESTFAEHHHFAPYNTFGNEADLWPVLPLCREHHREWHGRMDGYRWHRRGDVA